MLREIVGRERHSVNPLLRDTGVGSLSRPRTIQQRTRTRAPSDGDPTSGEVYHASMEWSLSARDEALL
jgi:hypothetical protein